MKILPKFERKHREPKPRSSREEALYHKAMAKLCAERGYENLAMSHIIASMESEGM